MSNVFDFLKREKFINIISILAIFISYTFLFLIISFVVLSNTAINNLQKKIEVSIFFKDEVTEEQILEYQNILTNDPRVSEVEYISKEKALEIFSNISQNEPLLQESLTSNILPASLKVKTYNLQDLESIEMEAISSDLVESTKFLRDIRDIFQYYANILIIVLSVLFLMFFTVSFGIVVSTIRINIFQKKDEIEIMKLVGATDDFIRKPFVYQGLVFSMLGSMLASVLILILLLAIYFLNLFGLATMNEVYLTNTFKIPYLLFVIFLVVIVNFISYLIGFFGTKSTISNYLKI
jgi:cell division transport system permease protein